MRIVKTRRGFAVAGDGPSYAYEGTKKACQAYIDWAVQVRAELAQFEVDKAARLAALLAERGIGPIDYRKLQPGDLFTWRPEVPPKAVTEARHFDNGASLILWEPDRYTPRSFAMTLMTPGYPAYGRTSS